MISSYQAANMQERMLNGASSTTPRLSLLLVASSALLHLLTRSFLSSRPAWLSLQLHVLQPSLPVFAQCPYAYLYAVTFPV